MNPHSLATSFFKTFLSSSRYLSLIFLLQTWQSIIGLAGGMGHMPLKPQALGMEHTHAHTHESAGHCLCHLIWHRLAYRDSTRPADESMIIIAKAMLCIIDIFRIQLSCRSCELHHWVLYRIPSISGTAHWAREARNVGWFCTVWWWK